MKKVAFIGLGKQNSKDHIKAAKNNPEVKIIAVCDVSESVARQCAEELGIDAYYTSVDEMLREVHIDAAIVAVPHFAYMPIITSLAEAGVDILKEKPFAMSLQEGIEMATLAEKHDINLTVSVQRKYNKIYKLYFDYIKQIGEVFSIHGEYTLNIQRLDEGWRSSLRHSGGGAVIDMGYHLVDLIVWYFGIPSTVSADLGYHNRTGQNYDVEDTAKIQFSYPAGERKVLGSMLLSRIYPQKDESLSVYGTSGSIKIYKERIELYNAEKELVESTYYKSDDRDIKEQFDMFIESLDTPSNHGNYKDHLRDMVFIDAVYRSDKEKKTILPLADTAYGDVINESMKG